MNAEEARQLANKKIIDEDSINMRTCRATIYLTATTGRFMTICPNIGTFYEDILKKEGYIVNQLYPEWPNTEFTTCVSWCKQTPS